MSLNQLKSITPDFLPKGFAEKRIDVITNNRALYSKQDFNTNDIIAEFFWKSVHAKPSFLTVQVSDHEHIELLPEYLECVNHSCDPNCFFNTSLKQFIALKPIKEGEELTFFYPSSEWDMGQAFRCGCGSKNCLGLIQGAKYLPKNAIKNYRFTDFIQQKLSSVRR